MDGTEVEGLGTCGVVLLVFIDPEVSVDPVVASFEVTDCALECLRASCANSSSSSSSLWLLVSEKTMSEGLALGVEEDSPGLELFTVD